MVNFTLVLTPAVNRTLGANSTTAAADEKLPRDWSAEGCLDTSLNSSSKSLQRTGYINVYKNGSPTLMARTFEVGDQNLVSGLNTQAYIVDAVAAITAYPGLSLA